MIGYLLSLILLVFGIFFDKVISGFFISHQNAIIYEIMSIISDLGAGISIFLIASFALSILADKTKKGFVKGKIFSFWAAFIVSMIVTYILKISVLRERPLSLNNVYNKFHSFPSGHTAGVFSAYAFMSKFRIFGIFWLAFSLLVAFSRVYLGVHYLSDVVAGGLIGYIISIGIQKLLSRKLEISKKLKGKKKYNKK